MTRSHRGKTCNGKKGGCKVCAVKFALVKAEKRRDREGNKQYTKMCVKKYTLN